MSSIHECKCDQCGKKEKLSWNGEHWLAPVGWLQFYNDATALVIDEHLCQFCHKKLKLKSKAKK